METARAADVALVVVGTSDEWETEGNDRSLMDLPLDQDALVAAVAAANPRTVVVLNTGSPVPMPWLDDVAAVLQVWFAGQELGDRSLVAGPSGHRGGVTVVALRVGSCWRSRSARRDDCRTSARPCGCAWATVAARCVRR